MGFERITPVRRANPILSAMQFASLTENEGKDWGGATMNVRTGRILPAGVHGYVVGGEPDTRGRRVPTQYVDPSRFTPQEVLAHRERIRTLTQGNRRANVGSWKNKGKVEVDASGTYEHRTEALQLGHARNEEAVWDNAAMDEIRLRSS